MPSSIAILLLAHGTPNALGEMADYLSKVTGGRPLPAEVVAELQHRYSEIGLRNEPAPEPPPLTKWTLAQGHLLQTALEKSGRPLPRSAELEYLHRPLPPRADECHRCNRCAEDRSHLRRCLARRARAD